MNTENKKNIYQKLLAIQTTLKAPKSLHNDYGDYYYRNAEGILEAVKPYLLEQGCVLLLKDEIEVIGSTVNAQTDEKGVKTVKEMARRYVKATAKLIDCETGETIETSAYANECEHKGMSGDQCTGTASSYARKYCLNALFLLDDTKDSDTNEMKNIENGGSKPAGQAATGSRGSCNGVGGTDAANQRQQAAGNTNWGKPNAAPPKQTASAQNTPPPSAKTANAWAKQSSKAASGWNKPKTPSNG